MLRGLPTPIPDDDSAPFWSGCANQKLLIQCCSECRTHRWPPGPGCPACGSTQSEWVAASGTGTVFSWVVVRVPLVGALQDQVPYAVGLIALDEDIRIVSTITGCKPEEIKPDIPVRVDFTATGEDTPIFTFVPAWVNVRTGGTSEGRKDLE